VTICDVISAVLEAAIRTKSVYMINRDWKQEKQRQYGNRRNVYI